jgi:hypothetical protein
MTKTRRGLTSKGWLGRSNIKGESHWQGALAARGEHSLSTPEHHCLPCLPCWACGFGVSAAKNSINAVSLCMNRPSLLHLHGGWGATHLQQHVAEGPHADGGSRAPLL